MSLTWPVRSPCLLAVPERSNLWLALRAFPVLVFGLHDGSEHGRPQRDKHEALLMSPCVGWFVGSNPVGWFRNRLVGFEPGWLVSNLVGWFRTRLVGSGSNPGLKFLASVPVCVTEGAST